MNETTNEPRNAQQALQQARLHERAQAILAAGYQFIEDKDTDVVAVVKPGRLAASYWINLLSEGCDCPDAMKGNYCKHRAAWKLLQEQAADDAANMEAQCAAWENAEGNHLDAIPTPTLMTLAVKDLIARLQADLQTVETSLATHEQRRVGYIHTRQVQDRAERLKYLLDTLAQYNSVK